MKNPEITIEQERAAVLMDMVAFYGADPDRRAYDRFEDTCLYYDKVTGNRCAVGRIVSEETAKLLPNEGLDVVMRAMQCIPGAEKDLVVLRRLGFYFLTAVQLWHDRKNLWGVSEDYLKVAKRINRNYCGGLAAL